VTTSLRVGAQVGGGRLATVHRGSLRGRAVAVKRARADVPGADVALLREARVLSAVSHPAIVPVLDLVPDPVAPALVLGWADGGSLFDLLADGPLEATELLPLVRPLADGLEAMHAAGVVHLDVTVENVLLAASGPLLIDPAPPGYGTPGYADPAVVAGCPPSPRSDVFGLAACTHMALTGRLPRRAGGVAPGLALGREVAEALAVGLHPDPHRRPGSPGAFVDLLAAAVPGAVAPRNRPADAPPGTVRAGSHARPVPRGPPRPTGSARTWPFDHWQEEAAAAEERQAAMAAAIGATQAPQRRRRRRVAVALALVTASGASAALYLRSSGPSRPAPMRPSASDSTQRPPAPRPPPTTTPGGKP
jgi:serine/threonine protein kinase